MYKKIKYILLIILAVLITCCSPMKGDDKSIRVAAILKTSTNPFFQLMWEGIKNEAINSGIEVDLFWPEKETDFEYQYNILSSKAYSYDAVILAPSDIANTYKYLPQLKKKNITVVILDVMPQLPESALHNDYYDVFAGTDNELGGRLAAEYAHSYIGVINNAIIIGGFKEHVMKRGRIVSFINNAKRLNPNIQIQIFTADYDRLKAAHIARRHIDSIKSSDLVYCANDHMALGVLDVIREMEIKSGPHIIGYDSIREAQQMILQGEMDASVVQYPALMGKEAVRAIVALKSSEYVPNKIMIPPRLSIKQTLIGTVGINELASK